MRFLQLFPVTKHYKQQPQPTSNKPPVPLGRERQERLLHQTPQPKSAQRGAVPQAQTRDVLGLGGGVRLRVADFTAATQKAGAETPEDWLAPEEWLEEGPLWALLDSLLPEELHTKRLENPSPHQGQT